MQDRGPWTNPEINFLLEVGIEFRFTFILYMALKYAFTYLFFPIAGGFQ